MKNKLGFTLIELLIYITILVNYRSLTEKKMGAPIVDAP